MTPDYIRDIRGLLGERWGLGKPLTTTQMARVLRLQGNSADATVLDWESGRKLPSGPVIVALELLLAGGRPSHLEAVLAAPSGINTGRDRTAQHERMPR